MVDVAAPNMPLACKLPIYEQYESYAPPFDVKRAVKRMLAIVPDKYLIGLGSIVLTNQKALKSRRARQMTRWRGKKVSAAKARGLYHPAWGSDTAWIELHMDSIFTKYPAWMRFPMTREMELSEVFFHELGHHIHAQHHPEFREKEDVADAWSTKGAGNYMWRRFWYLVPLFRFVAWAQKKWDITGHLRRRYARKAAAAKSNA